MSKPLDPFCLELAERFLKPDEPGAPDLARHIKESVEDWLALHRLAPEHRLRWRFKLLCPRCLKHSETVTDRLTPPPAVKCGDCLMEAVEVVQFAITGVEKA